MNSELELNAEVVTSIESPDPDQLMEEQLLSDVDELRRIAAEHLSEPSLPQTASTKKASPV